MDANTFHEINVIIAQLDSKLTSARYGQGRKGMITPNDIDYTVQQLRDALATIDMIQAQDNSHALNPGD